MCTQERGELKTSGLATLEMGELCLPRTGSGHNGGVSGSLSPMPSRPPLATVPLLGEAFTLSSSPYCKPGRE